MDDRVARRRTLVAAVAAAAILASSLAAAVGSRAATRSSARDRIETEAPILDLLIRSPGLPRAETERRLREVGVDSHEVGGRGLALDTPVLPAVFEEQRTVLVLGDLGRVASVHVQFLPEPSSRAAEVLRLYADVRSALVRLLGRPAWERAEGLGGDVSLAAISDGSLIRYLQWDGDVTVRAGIPRRVDGEVLVEIAVTRTALRRRQEHWGTRIF